MIYSVIRAYLVTFIGANVAGLLCSGNITWWVLEEGLKWAV